MAGGNLATQIARASAAMVMSWFTQNVVVSASVVFNWIVSLCCLDEKWILLPIWPSWKENPLYWKFFCWWHTPCFQGIKMESFPKCDFIPVDYYEVRHVKSAFKKLSRACVPSSPYPEDRGFLKAVEESEWLPQLQNILQISGAVVDLLDVQGSSVMIALEDGWDFTTQVRSRSRLIITRYLIYSTAII